MQIKKITLPIQWEDTLATGIPTIDEAHKTIIAKLNELYVLFAPNIVLGKEQILMRRMYVSAQARALLSFLEQYSKEHFKQEEEFMKCNACAFRVEHAKAHKVLVSLLDSWTVELHKDMHEGYSERMRQVVVDFGTWFERHLRTVDCKLRVKSKK